MKAIVIGGSGATGKFLVDKFLTNEQFTEITVLLRRKTFNDHPKLNQVIVDFEKLNEWKGLINGDVAFSCMGTTLKAAGSKDAQWKVDYGYQYEFAKIARENSIPVFVLLSSQNADVHSKIFYSRMKGQLERDVKVLDFDRLIILQPGILLRPDSDRTMETGAINIILAFNKIGLLRKYSPTHVNTVAGAMINSLNSDQSGLLIITGKAVQELGEQMN